MNENRSRPLRRSLGQRISLSYSAFLLYTLLIKLLIFSAV